MRLTLSLLLFSFAAIAGSDPPTACPPEKTKPAFENLDFSIGKIGDAPFGWLLGPEWWLRPNAPVYSAEVASGTSCNGGSRCAFVHTVGDPPNPKGSFLYQLVDAVPYRGKTVVLREDVRVDGSGTFARLLIRVHGKACSTTFRDDMGNNPVRKSEWNTYELRGPVSDDAVYLEIGTQFFGVGSMWIDNLSVGSRPRTN